MFTESIKQKNPKDPDVVKKAKSFFASCNSEGKLNLAMCYEIENKQTISIKLPGKCG